MTDNEDLPEFETVPEFIEAEDGSDYAPAGYVVPDYDETEPLMGHEIREEDK